jgi:hypothetical protein
MRFLRDPYVLKLLQERMDAAEEKSIVTRNQVMYGLLKEAHYTGADGNASSRIAAWSKLAKILGMEIFKFEGTVKVRASVMVVPMAESSEQWEAVAAQKQAELVKVRAN